MKNWLQKSLIWFGGLTLVGFVILSQTKLTQCLSESLEGIGYMLFLKHTRVQVGDIVLIQDHREDHVAELRKWPYSKRVLGVFGDRILKDRHGIRVSLLHCKNNPGKAQPCISKVLPLLDKTSKGKPLTPISAKVIPKNYVFVAGDNPNSFDSRYEEFGLVPVQKIWGKAVWTW